MWNRSPKTKKEKRIKLLLQKLIGINTLYAKRKLFQQFNHKMQHVCNCETELSVSETLPTQGFSQEWAEYKNCSSEL